MGTHDSEVQIKDYKRGTRCVPARHQGKGLNAWTRFPRMGSVKYNKSKKYCGGNPKVQNWRGQICRSLETSDCVSSLGLVSFCFCCHNVFKGLNRRPFCNFNRDLEMQPGTVFFFFPSFVPLPPQPSPSINHKTGNGRVRRIDAGWVGSAASLCVVCRTGLVTTTEKPERCETPRNVQGGTRTCDRTRSALFYMPSFEKMDFFCQARLTLRYSSASKSPAIDVSP